MTWHTYEIPPIDLGWENLSTVQEALAQLVARGSSDVRHDIDESSVRQFLANWESAKQAASAAGWEGDFRDAPAVFWLPAESEFEYGFVLKQDNNGTTYVVTPIAMPWLAGT